MIDIKHLEVLLKTYPIGGTFYVLMKGTTRCWITSETVFAYRIFDDEIFLVAAVGDEFINAVYYNINECYPSKEEAKKHIPASYQEAAKLVSVAIDHDGREIPYAIYDEDSVVQVIPQYISHITACCIEHGCKYDNPQCPVVQGQLLQKHLCPKCLDNSDPSNTITERTRWQQIRHLYQSRKNKHCKDCKSFLGCGDWDLCCKTPPASASSNWLGFLCYEDSLPCVNFKNIGDSDE